MTFAQKLGASYDAVKDKAKIKKITIDVGETAFNLRVRIPLKSEVEQITEIITNPPEEKVEAIYQKYAAPLLETIKESGDDLLQAINKEKQTIVIKENDVEVNGTSLRQVASMTAMYETRVEKYFHLLQSESGEPINETYEQISEEFPEAIVKIILDEIDKAIKPDYNTAKKN